MKLALAVSIVVVVVAPPCRSQTAIPWHTLRAAPFLTSADRPFDLSGRSLQFTPVSDQAYVVSSTPLQYDSNVGGLLQRFMRVGSLHYTTYRITSFTFPFGGIRRSEIDPYEAGAIFFSVPPIVQPPLTEGSLQQLPFPMIAPFLVPRTVVSPPTVDLFVRETSDSLLLTWRVPADLYSGNFAYDVQARLESDGGIVFSYRVTGGITWPAVAVIAGPLLPPIPPAPPPRFQNVDLSAVNGMVPLPIVEVFSAPTLDPGLVWASLKTTFGYRDDDIDAVAIYQDFTTDIVNFASAYCIIGNPGVDGVMNRVRADEIQFGTRFPLRTAQMHMGNITQATPGAPNTWVFVHEFAHRWLYWFDYTLDGVTKTQNGHPSYFTNTTAAFPQPGANATYSPIGGNSWTDKGNNTYSTYYCGVEPGFSWHELYLMGLAAPEEVASWFFLDDATLTGFASPCISIYTLSGRRHDIGIDNILQANGARVPGVATSGKVFKVVLVLLTRDVDSVRPEILLRMRELQTGAAAAFARATGSRGKMIMVPEARRGRAVRK